MNEVLVIAGQEIPAGTRASVRIPVARRITGAPVELPVHVVHGRHPGPRLFVSAAIHGDEINGTEVIRRLLNMRTLNRLSGSLIAVPIVNIYGFVAHSRYLPDRRDLNRSFPGSSSGSLAARLAHTFMTEIALNSTHGIDLHTGAIHRSNLPQVRACLDDPETDRLARAFGAPVIIDSALRDGSLRGEVRARGIPMLLFEGGEALRFDEFAIRAGLGGVVSVMRALGMLRPSKKRRASTEPFVARSSTWVRAPESGILSTQTQLGARVAEGEVIGNIYDPLGDQEMPVIASTDGVVIGRTNLPLVNEGDALFHVGVFKRVDRVLEQVEAFREELAPDFID